jgi:sialic acid synthase SpsE
MTIPYSLRKEKKIMKLVRKSIVAKKDIPRGMKMTKEVLTIKRPGTGIEPKFLEKVVGKIAKIDIKKDELITFKYLK